MNKLIESKQISVQNMIDITPFLLEAQKEFEENIIDACYFGSQNLPYEVKDKSKQYYKETFN